MSPYGHPRRCKGLIGRNYNRHDCQQPHSHLTRRSTRSRSRLMRLQGTTVNTAVGTRCTPQASALLQVLAERSHVARIERWLKGSARRAPAARGAQPAVRLCCVRAGRAVSVSITCHREAEARSSMPSTARMVVKPAGRCNHHWLLHLLALQRRRRMDAAAHAGGPSHRCALQLQCSPMRLPACHMYRHAGNGSRQLSSWHPGAREGPRARCARRARI